MESILAVHRQPYINKKAATKVRPHLKTISLEDLRHEIKIPRNLLILCGAGVSMIPPTELPSGNALRDMCVRGLLTDSISASAIDRLISSPAYQALLPEAVLQLMGSTIGQSVDRFVAKLLKVFLVP